MMIDGRLLSYFLLVAAYSDEGLLLQPLLWLSRYCTFLSAVAVAFFLVILKTLPSGLRMLSLDVGRRRSFDR